MSCSGIPRLDSTELPNRTLRMARVPFSACPEKGTKEKTPRGGAPARLRRAGVPAAGDVLGAAVKGHPVPSRLDRPSGPILPCARRQPPRHQGGGQNGSSLRDIARGRPRHLQRCREAASQSDPCPLRVMRDRLAGGKSQRASRLGHGRPSQGHLEQCAEEEGPRASGDPTGASATRSGRPSLVTAAIFARDMRVVARRPWRYLFAKTTPRPGLPCPGAPRAAKCHWHFGRCSPPSTASEPGTCRGAAAAGHPAGTMVLVTFAETKVTRALQRRCYGSEPVSSAEPLSTPFSKEIAHEAGDAPNCCPTPCRRAPA